jgi:hypothetical protein
VGRAREQLLAALSAFQRIGARRYVAQIETTLEQHGIR